MRKLWALALAMVLLVGIGAAMASEQVKVTGKIKAVMATERMFTLEDGTQLWVAEGLEAEKLQKLQEGKVVKASYEEREGKKVVVDFEVSEPE